MVTGAAALPATSKALRRCGAEGLVAVLEALGSGPHTSASRGCVERLAAQVNLKSEMKALRKQKKAAKKMAPDQEKEGICFCCHKICQVPRACSRCKAVYWSVWINKARVIYESLKHSRAHALTSTHTHTLTVRRNVRYRIGKRVHTSRCASSDNRRVQTWWAHPHLPPPK